MTRVIVPVPSHRALVLAFAVWTGLLVLILWPEAAALSAHQTYRTLSFYLQTIRRDRIGRFIVLPFGCWMFLHICVAPRWLGTNPNNWRLWIGLVIGVAWALGETFSWLGMHP